jgi:hypothetical protein
MMSLSTRDIRKALTDSTAVYAWIGAGDAAVSALRGLSARAIQVRDRATEVPAQLVELPRQVPRRLGELQASAVRQYDDLAARGRRLVTRIRRQRATVVLEQQVQNTARSVKAARTTATKSVDSTTRATKGATTSVRKTARAAASAVEAGAGKVGK